MSEEGFVTAARLMEILRKLPPGQILVGGQALAFWIARYAIDFDNERSPAISRDADFFGRRGNVDEIAQALGGRTVYPPQRAVTILAGQVIIDISEDEHLNIDVINKLCGLKGSFVARCVDVVIDSASFKVMHPIDVLVSRVENLAGIAEKQNEIGISQVILAMRVASALIVQAIDEGSDLATTYIEKVFDTFKSPAGKKVLREYGVDVFDAVPAAVSRIGGTFFSERWPRILAEHKQKTAEFSGRSRGPAS